GCHGTFGFGQIHAVEYSRLPRSAVPRNLSAGQRGCRGIAVESTGRIAESPDRLRVSKFQSHSTDECAGKRAATLVLPRPAARRAARQGCGGAEAGRGGRTGASFPHPVVRGPATACRDCPCVDYGAI